MDKKWSETGVWGAIGAGFTASGIGLVNLQQSIGYGMTIFGVLILCLAWYKERDRHIERPQEFLKAAIFEGKDLMHSDELNQVSLESFWTKILAGVKKHFGDAHYNKIIDLIDTKEIHMNASYANYNSAILKIIKKLRTLEQPNAYK